MEKMNAANARRTRGVMKRWRWRSWKARGVNGVCILVMLHEERWDATQFGIRSAFEGAVCGRGNDVAHPAFGVNPPCPRSDRLCELARFARMSRCTPGAA